MITFKQYINESDDGKLKHIEHLDDMHINAGHEGFNHAIDALHLAKEHSEGKRSGHELTTKFDGSPSVVYGHHPETGKFFVASKSAFNKTPKINYTPEDIEANHGHAPGLVGKLKDALKHLPKITPKHGVFQGDVMHSGTDVHHNTDGSVSFKPNTLTYTAKGEEADKVKKSKFGIAPHTEYKGDTLESMRSEPIKDFSKFKSHKDVHVITPEFKAKEHSWPKEHEHYFKMNVDAAKKSATKIDHSAISPHIEHLKTYINSGVRNNTANSLHGYVMHLENKRDKAVGSVKTQSTKDAKAKHFNDLITSVTNQDKESVENTLQTQHHLANAKDVVIHHLEKSNTGLSAHVNDTLGHEGYVSTHTGSLIKLVDRKKFSAANFARNG